MEGLDRMGLPVFDQTAKAFTEKLITDISANCPSFWGS